MRRTSNDPASLSRIERRVFVAPTVKAGDSVRYGDWRDRPTDQHWIEVRKHGDLRNISEGYYTTGIPLTLIEVATGSDYSGTLVEISNAITLKERFPWLVEVYGGHGTRGVAYLGERENQNPELIEAIDSLTDYPIFDEDHHAHLEMETVDEAWASDGRDDFKRALVKYFDALYEPDEHDKDLLPDDGVDRLWYDATERLMGGEGHLNESGDQIYFPIRDVIEKFERSWPGMSRPGYDGGESLDARLLALAEAATIPVVHLSPTTGEIAACGASVHADGGSSADINYVTCDACTDVHNATTIDPSTFDTEE